MPTNDQLKIPVSLLVSTELLPSAKLVLIALLLDSSLEPQLRHSKTRLAARTGLTRPTIYKALTSLKANGWYSIDKQYNKEKLCGPTTAIYIDMFLDTTLSAQTRLFHGLLQLTTDFYHKTPKSKYSTLSKDLNIGLKTIRNAVGQLVKSGWLSIEQAHRHAPISFTFLHPIRKQIKIMMDRAKRNLKNAQYKGEALMKEFLSLIVSTDHYMDNTKPGFLRNTDTDCLMEFDRYYPNIVAFEFNGSQHYQPTELYDIETVGKQRIRDKLKKQICTDNNVKLVIIHPTDLTIAGMFSKIGGLLPLRELRNKERLINFLERVSANYNRKIPAAYQQP